MFVESRIFGRSWKIEKYETKVALYTNPLRKEWVLRHLPTFSRLVGLSVVITPKSISLKELAVYDMLFGKPIEAEFASTERQRRKRWELVPSEAIYTSPGELATAMAEALHWNLGFSAVPATIDRVEVADIEEEEVLDMQKFLKLEQEKFVIQESLKQLLNSIPKVEDEEELDWIAFAISKNCVQMVRDEDVNMHLEEPYVTEKVLDACKPSLIIEISEDFFDVAMLNIYSDELWDSFYDIHISGVGKMDEDLIHFCGLYLTYAGRELIGELLSAPGDFDQEKFVTNARLGYVPDEVLEQARRCFYEYGSAIVSDTVEEGDILESKNYSEVLLGCENFIAEHQ